ncbi:hypothetical protein LTR94_030405, partial [Friedmanniomyces endolithicus]
AYQNGDPVVIDGVTYTPSGPGTLTGQPGTDVRAFLTASMTAFDKANQGLTDQIAKNGLVQNHVDTALEAHEGQQIALTQMMQNKSGYDPARAITDLQQAQVAIEASAQVINSLRSTSLLDLLR